MRKAFTMIEIILVIVITGILAAIAIPKLAANRDDAKSSVCAFEVGQLIHEIGNSYIDAGYSAFKDLSIKSMTNLHTDVGLVKNGIFEVASTKVDTSGVTYYCEGEAIMTLTGHLSGNDYNLTVVDQTPSTIIGLKAAIKLRKVHAMSEGSTRQYRL